MSALIQKPADSRFTKTLVFAPGGNGKTHFLGTAQEDERTYPMLLMDFEGGEETLVGLDIDVAPIRSWDDYSEVYELLASGDHSYKSVGLDSASETHIWALLQRITLDADRRRDPDLIEQGDYGAAMTQMRRLLREFRDLPLHVFYTAGSKDMDERGVGRVKVPSLAGQMADEIVHLMSVVGYLAKTETEEGEPQRVLLLQNYPGFRTKARTPWGHEAPDEIVDPTVTKLLDGLGFPLESSSTTKHNKPKTKKEH